LFGSRTAKNLRSLLTELGEYSRIKLKEQLVSATARFYRAVDSGLTEKLHDLTFCRQRLTYLERVMEPDSAGSHTGSHPGLLPSGSSTANLSSVAYRGTEQVLLPFGESDIEWAAARFVMNVNGEQWIQLEQVLQSLVLAPLGGLHAICQKAGDLMGQLAGPLIDQTAAYLNKILDVADVAEGEFVAGGKRANIVALVQKCWERARPLVSGDTRDQSGYLIVPATEAGGALSQEVCEALPSIKILQALGQTSDIMVCREQKNLASKDLSQIVGHCREAYLEMAARASTSPHSRFDILEWMPLDA
jgi:hypothetical protein